jgi:hypothetical protein
MAPHQLTHGRIAFDPAQQVVFFGSEHGVLLGAGMIDTVDRRCTY